MLVICNNYISVVRFKNIGKYHSFNFRLNLKYGIRNNNRHKRFSYWNENYKRFDDKYKKISN